MGTHELEKAVTLTEHPATSQPALLVRVRTFARGGRQRCFRWQVRSGRSALRRVVGLPVLMSDAAARRSAMYVDRAVSHEPRSTVPNVQREYLPTPVGIVAPSYVWNVSQPWESCDTSVTSESRNIGREWARVSGCQGECQSSAELSLVPRSLNSVGS